MRVQQASSSYNHLPIKWPTLIQQQSQAARAPRPKTRKRQREGYAQSAALPHLPRPARPPTSSSSVDLLHLARLVIVLLERRQLLALTLLVVVLNRETELDHAVDAPGEGGGLVEREARRERRRLEEQVHQVLDRLVALVGRRLGLELLHDRVARVDLHGLLRRHVRRHRAVAQRLGAHDALHVGRPAVLAGDEAARRLGDALRVDNLLHLVAEDLLHQLAQRLEVGGELLPRLLLLLSLLKLEPLLGHRDELLAVILLEL